MNTAPCPREQSVGRLGCSPEGRQGLKQVWIVFEYYEYEGEEIIGVFATEEAAAAEAGRLEAPDHPSRVSYHVRGYEVQGS